MIEEGGIKPNNNQQENVNLYITADDTETIDAAIEEPEIEEPADINVVRQPFLFSI